MKCIIFNKKYHLKSIFFKIENNFSFLDKIINLNQKILKIIHIGLVFFFSYLNYYNLADAVSVSNLKNPFLKM